MLYSIHCEVKIDPQAFAFETGYAFRGLTISEGPQGWRIILRATKSDGEDVYSMTEAIDIHEGFEKLYDAVTGKESGYLWHHDRFSSRNKEVR